MNVLRVGEELARRGHTFIWLMSDSEPSSQTLIKLRGFENLTVLEYKAKDEHFAKADLARDPVEVQQQSGRQTGVWAAFLQTWA